MNSPTVSSIGMKRTSALRSGSLMKRLQRRRQAQQRRHALAVLEVAQLQRDREAEIGNERERMRRVDRQRRQHRENLLQEMVLQPGELVLGRAGRRRCSRCPPCAAGRRGRTSCSAGLPAAVRLRAGSAPAAARACGRPGCAAAMPSRTWPARPATRTMKNSSRLAAEIDRKRTRSSSGWQTFCDSSRTRRLNCSQENSRLTKRSGFPETPSLSAVATAVNSPEPASTRSYRRSSLAMPHSWPTSGAIYLLTGFCDSLISCSLQSRQLCDKR